MGPPHRHGRVRGGAGHRPPARPAGLDAAGALPRLRVLGRRLGARRAARRRHRRSARGWRGPAMDAAFFGQLGGVDAAVDRAASARPGSILDPAVVAGVRRRRRGRSWPRPTAGDPRDRLLEVEPAPVIERDGGRPRRRGRGVRRPRRREGAVPPRPLAGGGPARGRAPPAGSASTDARSVASRSPASCTTSAGSGSPTRSGRSRRRSPASSGSRCACTPTTPNGSWPPRRRWSRSRPSPACTTSGSTAPATTGARRRPPSRWQPASSPRPTPSPPWCSPARTAPR